jgi:hypothetical protein
MGRWDLMGIPWRVAFALQDDGWWLRQDIIWNKPNPMPESVTDRCTKSHEYIFLLSKSAKYYFDQDAIKEPIKDVSVQRLLTESPVVFGGNNHCPDTRLQSGKEWKPKGRDRSNGNRNGLGASTLDQKNLSVNGRKNHSFHESRVKGYEHRGNGDKPLTGHSGNFDANGELIGDGTANKKSVWTVTTRPFSQWQETSRLERVQGDADSGDIAHIVFPDCRACADHFDLSANALCGERVSDVLTRIERICSRLAPELADDFAPIGLSLVSDSWQRNSGSDRLRYLISAKDRNSQIHRKARALVTNLSYTTFVQILSSIDDRLDGLLWSVLGLDTYGNNISLDGMDARLLAKIPHRKTDKSSCSYCQFYHVRVSKTSHFATFPPKLIEPCILAGSREGDTVLDPFSGAGTTGLVSLRHKRKYVGIELNPDYIAITEKRLAEIQVNLF